MWLKQKKYLHWPAEITFRNGLVCGSRHDKELIKEEFDRFVERANGEIEGWVDKDQDVFLKE